jgi:hypothetical protein
MGMPQAKCLDLFASACARAQLDALLDQLRPGDTVVVWRPDGFGGA